MKITLPKHFLGKSVAGTLERVLAGTPTSTPTSSTTPPSIVTTPTITDPQNYIILPGTIHGKYTYPQLLVSMTITHKNKNWNDTHAALAAEQASMLSPRQFVDFLNLLQRGNSAYDGLGKKLSKKKCDAILDEIWTVRDPWRAEWFDAKFESRGGLAGIGTKLFINYGHTFQNNTVTPTHSEELTGYLANDKTPGIDKDDWLAKATVHGLPARSISDGQLYYWHPHNGKVAGFYANSVWASLYCGWDPSYTDARLGVRAAREKNIRIKL